MDESDTPPFLVTSYLHMRIASKADLPEDCRSLVYNKAAGEFRPFFPCNVPPDKLDAAIAEGRVYVLWSYDQRKLAEPERDWPQSTAPARPEIYLDT